MGGTRIDDSSRRTLDTSDCDEQALVCGAQPKSNAPIAGAPDPKTSKPDDNWLPSLLPEAKPSQLAQVAKNMAAPRTVAPQVAAPVPNEAALRAEYEKMSDAELEKAVHTLATRLSNGGPNSSTDADLARFHAAEAVAKARADAARPPERTEGEHTEHLLPYFDEAMHRGKNVTVMHATAEYTPSHLGFGLTALHAHWAKKLGGVDVSASGDVGSVGMDEGIHNADGSTGIHASGGATLAAGEVTVHKHGVGSVTVGPSAGASAEFSGGFKKDGDTTEACVRIGLDVVTFGVCIPVEKEAH